MGLRVVALARVERRPFSTGHRPNVSVESAISISRVRPTMPFVSDSLHSAYASYGLFALHTFRFLAPMLVTVGDVNE